GTYSMQPLQGCPTFELVQNYIQDLLYLVIHLFLLSFILPYGLSEKSEGVVGAIIKKIIKMALIMPFPPSGDIFG
ncbi:MAG: hypothetical protein WBG58_14760, partial [Ignavibacteriaceae bacterium]